MDMGALFTVAIGLQNPWKVVEVTFDTEASELQLRLDFVRGSTFPCPDCGDACKVHDAPERRWRHLNFFQHKAYLVARHPRVDCTKHGVLQVAVPWARPGSGFTLMFEALAVMLARSMPMAAVARTMGEHDTRLWRVIQHHVSCGKERLNLSNVRRVGLDETSRAKGQRYLTLFVDADAARVVDVRAGRTADTVQGFRNWLVEHEGDPEQVTDFSLDMSAAYQKGVRESFPNAEITFDKFHVIQLANDVVDKVRRAEQKELQAPELKRSRFLFLRNAKDLSASQEERLEAAKMVAKKAARAYEFRETLQEFYRQSDAVSAQKYFDVWHKDASTCELEPVRTMAQTLKDHLPGLLRWFSSRITNALLEGFSSLVQSAKAAARGYRNASYMADMISLRLGNLDLCLPSPVPQPI